MAQGLPSSDAVFDTGVGLYFSAIVIGAMAAVTFGYFAVHFFQGLIPFSLAKSIMARVGVQLAPSDMQWFTRDCGVGLGMVVGFTSRIFSAKQINRFQAEMQKIAKRFGGVYQADIDSSLSQTLSVFLDDLFSGKVSQVTVADVLRVQQSGTDYSVFTLSYVLYHNSMNNSYNSGNNLTTTTAAFCAPGQPPLPHFTLQPDGIMLKALTRLAGIPQIDFPSHPEFSRRYKLNAERADWARNLFNDSLIDVLMRHQGLTIQSCTNGVMITRGHGEVVVNEMAGFTQAAGEIFAALADAAKRTGVPEGFESGAKLDVDAMAREAPAIMRKFIRDELLTRAQIREFTNQPTPRKLPKQFLAYRKRAGGGFLVMLGLVFAAVGIFFCGIGLQAGQREGTAIGVALTALAAVCLVVAGRSRHRITKMLRDGVPASASIENLKDTNVAINGQPVYRLFVRFTADGREIQANSKIRGDAVQRAKRQLKEGEPVPILFDAANPGDFLFLDSLINIGLDYEP